MSDGAVVLDASALLALLQREPGAERVRRALPGAAMSAVNFSEVVAKLADRGMPADAIREVLDGLDLDVRPFDTELAYAAGELRRATRAMGLALGAIAPASHSPPAWMAPADKRSGLARDDGGRIVH